MLHYSTIFIPHLSNGYDSLGMLQPGKAVPWPGMAKLTVANAQPESHLDPEALEFKHALPFRLLA